MGKIILILVYLSVFLRVFCLIDSTCAKKINELEIKNNLSMANRVIINNIEMSKDNKKAMSTNNKNMLQNDLMKLVNEYDDFLTRHTNLFNDMFIDYKIVINQNRIAYINSSGEIVWVDIIDCKDNYEVYNISNEYNKKIKKEIERKINRFMYNESIDMNNIYIEQNSEKIVTKIIYIYHKKKEMNIINNKATTILTKEFTIK